MNKTEMFHNERKEYWRELITRCDASGLNQRDWCLENNICSTSMSKWRNTIWREEEAEKEFAAAREERAFVEMKVNQTENEGGAKELIVGKKEVCAQSTVKAKPIRYSQEAGSIMKPDAVIGYLDYMVGVYEHTSCQVLQKIMEVLKYA